MHQLALALHHMGHTITGSDDGFFDPSKTNLAQAGILPEQEGWFPDKVTDKLDGVVLGMHAKADNPELLKAQQLGLPVYSFPEFIFQNSINKQRVVIAGSHGKTTITSMVAHVLKQNGRDFDYLIGAQVEGFEGMVKITDAPVIVLEGDEYLTSPLDLTPKFLHYNHHIALISGIAWDHANVFPTEEDYVRQFELLADQTPKAGTLIICEEDPIASIIGNKNREDVTTITYSTHKTKEKDGEVYLKGPDGRVPIKVFGRHNLQNIQGAYHVCQRLGITDEEFYSAIQSFKGAAKRLQLLAENDSTTVYRDFAHAPSKLQASVTAMKERYPKRTLVGVLELHTFSSLNQDFLPQYNGTFSNADVPVVFYNPEVVQKKGLASLDESAIRKAFGQNNIQIFTEAEELQAFLNQQIGTNTNFLLMSSANFGGIDLQEVAGQLTSN